MPVHEESKTVRVFHIRHWAHRGMSTDELGEIMDELDEEAFTKPPTLALVGVRHAEPVIPTARPYHTQGTDKVSV